MALLLRDLLRLIPEQLLHQLDRGRRRLMHAGDDLGYFFGACVADVDLPLFSLAVSNLKCNTRRDSGCSHEAAFQTH